MKKILFLTLLSVSVILVSCGQSEIGQEQNSNNNLQEKHIGQDVSDSITKEVVNMEKQEVSGASEEKMNSTMIDIFKKGKDATCTFKITNEGNSFDAIMYIEGKKLRYIMSGEIEGNKMENNVIIKDGYSYSWTNMSKDGFKMKEDILGKEDAINKPIGEEGNEAQELNEKVEFNCKYTVDSSKFILPQGINFQDMGNIPQMPIGN